MNNPSADPEGSELQNVVNEEFANAEPFITKHTDPPRETQPLQEGQGPPHYEHILQFFAYDHLPQHLQDVSRPFSSIATNVIMRLPRSPERTAALRKLLESKDAAVRAFIAK